MDPGTQGLLGACLSGAISNKKNLRLALTCGMIGGIAPDIDILIKSDNDPLIFIESIYHFLMGNSPRFEDNLIKRLNKLQKFTITVA